MTLKENIFFKNRKIFFFFLLAYLLSSIFCLIYLRDYKAFIWGDARYYLLTAKNLVDKFSYSDSLNLSSPSPTAFRVPLYSLVVSFFYLISFKNWYWAIFFLLVFQQLLDISISFFLYRIILFLTKNNRLAFIGSLSYFSLIMVRIYSFLILRENLIFFLLVFYLYCLFDLLDKYLQLEKKDVIFLALSVTLLLLTKPTFAFLPFLTVSFFILKVLDDSKQKVFILFFKISSIFFIYLFFFLFSQKRFSLIIIFSLYFIFLDLMMVFFIKWVDLKRLLKIMGIFVIVVSLTYSFWVLRNYLSLGKIVIFSDMPSLADDEYGYLFWLNSWKTRFSQLENYLWRIENNFSKLPQLGYFSGKEKKKLKEIVESIKEEKRKLKNDNSEKFYSEESFPKFIFNRKIGKKFKLLAEEKINENFWKYYFYLPTIRMRKIWINRGENLYFIIVKFILLLPYLIIFLDTSFYPSIIFLLLQFNFTIIGTFSVTESYVMGGFILLLVVFFYYINIILRRVNGINENTICS